MAKSQPSFLPSTEAPPPNTARRPLQSMACIQAQNNSSDHPGNMSHKGRNRDPGRMPREPVVTHKKSTALMEAQLESLKRNSGSELIKAGDKRLRPKADATLKMKFESRPLRGRRHRSDRS
jgi:hypothetical protein